MCPLPVLGGAVAILISAFTLALGVSPASASIVLFSDLQAGFQAINSPIQSTTTWANQFVSPGTVANTYILSDIDLALASQNPTVPTSVKVALTADSSTCSPGVFICPGSALFSGTINNVGSPGAVLSLPVPPSPAITLIGNTPYWVEASWPGGNAPFAMWFDNNSGLNGNVWNTNPVLGGSSEFTGLLFGFAVNAASPSAVPEPSTLLLIGSAFPGTLGCLWVRRRRKDLDKSALIAGDSRHSSL